MAAALAGSVAMLCTSGLVAWRMWLSHVVALQDSRLAAAEMRRAADDTAVRAKLAVVDELVAWKARIENERAYSNRR